jgi:hypothetical protein
MKSEGDTGTNGRQSAIEGTEAAARFDALVRKVLSVPHAEIMRREAEYKRQSAMNPNRRGPKPKDKPAPNPSA